MLGAVVVVLGACNFICRFRATCAGGSEHAHRYNELITKSALLSTEASLARLPELEMHDSPVPECMENVAYNKACMSLNISHRISLFRWKDDGCHYDVVFPISALRVSSLTPAMFLSVVRVYECNPRRFPRGGVIPCVSGLVLLVRPVAPCLPKIVDFTHKAGLRITAI